LTASGVCVLFVGRIDIIRLGINSDLHYMYSFIEKLDKCEKSEDVRCEAAGEQQSMIQESTETVDNNSRHQQFQASKNQSA
jgi:hypothetical protein